MRQLVLRDVEQRLVSETPNITGDWYSPNGGVFTFSQVGSSVRVEGSAAGISLSGRGQIRGKSIRIQGFSLGGGPFQAGLAVSADGKTITGQIVDGFGRSSPSQPPTRSQTVTVATQPRRGRWQCQRRAPSK